MKSLFSIFFFVSASIAGAQTTAELLSQLKDAVKAEIRTSLDVKERTELLRLEQLRQSVVQLEQVEADDDLSARSLHAVETLGLLTLSDQVADLSRTLAGQLRGEQKKRNAAFTAEMKQVFTSALRAMLSAKTAKDLDGPIAAVDAVAQKTNSGFYDDPKLPLLANQGQQLSELLRRWQDFLVSRESEDGESHRMQWQLLTTGGDFSEFVPRSAILTRIAELEKDRKPNVVSNETKAAKTDEWSAKEAQEAVVKIVDDTPDLKSIGEAIRKLETLAASHGNGPPSNDVSAALHMLGTLQHIYLDLEQGRPTTIHLLDMSEDTSSPILMALSRLRLQLRLYALPRALGLGEEGAARSGEDSINYLNRIAADARKKGDWASLGRTAEIAQTLKIEISTVGSDRTALQSFLAGSNQERAAQYALAVGSFEAALKAGSQIIPPETIGEHLEAIRKEYPQEYEQGLQNTLTPPRSPDPRYMDPRSRMPNFPGNPYQQQPAPSSAPTISIPAATPRALPTPGAQPGGTTDATKAQ